MISSDMYVALLLTQFPVRCKMLAKHKNKMAQRVSKLLRAMAMAHPHVRITATVHHTYEPCSLKERLRCFMPHVRQTVSVHARVVFTTIESAWDATLEGFIGQADGAHHFLSVNGIPIISRSEGLLAAAASHLPWPWDNTRDDLQGRSWATYLLDTFSLPSTTILAFHLRIEKTESQPKDIVKNWSTLFSCLMGQIYPSCPLPEPTPTIVRPAFRISPYFLTSTTVTPSVQMQRNDLDTPAMPAILPSSLATTQPLAQVDQKYIMCINRDEVENTLSLLCMDQHAVDERVRLEKLLFTYLLACLNGEGQSCSLTNPPTLQLSLTQETLNDLSFWGWTFQRKSSCPHEWLMHAVPTPFESLCLPNKIPELLSVTATTAAWVCEHPHTPIKVQHTVHYAEGWMSMARHIPPPLYQACATHACHTAIRTSISHSR